jgi:hypothetical protein
MPPAYPVSIPDVLSVLNLPADMETNSVFKNHAPLVLELVRLVVIDNYYQSAFDPRVGEMMLSISPFVMPTVSTCFIPPASSSI